MAEESSASSSDSLPPFITVVMDKEKGEQLISNIRQDMRPAMLWLLEWAKLQVMAGNLKPPSPIIKPNGGMDGLIKRAGLMR